MTNESGLEQHTIALTPEEFERFKFVCDNPQQPNDALSGLIAPTEYARLKIAQLERELKDWTHALEVLSAANGTDKRRKFCGDCKECSNSIKKPTQ